MLGKLLPPAASSSSPLAGCVVSLFSSQTRQVSLLSRAAVKVIKECLNKPKAGINGYNLFFQEKYPSLKNEFPNFGVVDISRRLGSHWNSLSETEKKIYQDRAIKMSEQNKADLLAYREALTPRQKLALRALSYNQRYRKGAVERAEMPKEVKEFVKALPAPPFLTGRSMFIASKLRGRVDAIGMLPDVAAEWKKLPASEAKVFQERALADMKMFRETLSKYLE